MASTMVKTDRTASTPPKARASFLVMRPAATGRRRVRRISASVVPSSAMLSAPAEPAPSAMHRMATKARNGFMATGETTRPVAAVNTTSDMTRGFNS